MDDFPQEIVDFYNFSKKKEYKHWQEVPGIYGKSFEECESLCQKVYSAFYDQNITEEKIICYNFQFNHPSIFSGQKEFVTEKSTRQIFHAPHIAIGIEYRVLYRINIGGETFLSNMNYEFSKQPEIGFKQGGAKMSRENGHHHYNNWLKVPHTEELEKFFENVEKNLSVLISKVNDFFGESEVNLLDNLKNGKLLTQSKLYGKNRKRNR